MVNYKGQYFNDNNEKYTDEATGAHFRYDDLITRLVVAKQQRDIRDQESSIETYSCQYVKKGQ